MLPVPDITAVRPVHFHGMFRTAKLAHSGNKPYLYRMSSMRPAHIADLSNIMTVLEAAKGIMRGSGNLHQWVNGYPSEAVIRADIAAGYGYVMCEADTIVAYFAFIPSPEPTYERIYGGTWLDNTAPYHVIHRIGSTPESHGVFRAIMDWCLEREPNLRIDTHRDNAIMQHCILAYGFRYCGVIYLASGDERLAYQLNRGK